jgi:hypothetical protein
MGFTALSVFFVSPSSDGWPDTLTSMMRIDWPVIL